MVPLAPSLRAQRSNPESLRGKNLDCFAALAMTVLRQLRATTPNLIPTTVVCETATSAKPRHRLDSPSPQLKPIPNDRSLRPADRPLPQLARRAARPHLRELRGDAAMVGARSRRLLAQHLGLLRSAVADAVCGRHHRAQDAGRGLVSRRAGELCAAGVPACRRCACRRPARDRQRRRGRQAERDQLAGAQAQGGRARAAPEGQGHQARRPHRGLSAQHRGDHHRISRERQHRCGLERLRARHGSARRDRPLQADRAKGADRVRRRHLCRAQA
ncbi:hypothetical protein ACVWYH_008872 [Bradyrhizobium sp. GM24.11]